MSLWFCGRGGGHRSRGGRGSSGAAFLGRREIAGDLILADVEYDDFVGGHARAALHIELNGFAGSFILLFDGLVVSYDGHGVLCFFRIGLVKRHLHRADALRVLGFLQGELVIVAVAPAPEIFQVIAVVRDEAAHDVHVAQAALEFAFGSFQIGFCSLDVFFGAADLGSHRADFFLVFLLSLRELRGEFLVRRLLLLADGFGAALGLRELGLRQADFLCGEFHLALQIGDARVRLVELGDENLVLILLLGEILAHPRLRGIAGDAQHGQRGNHDAEQHGDPPRRTGGFVLIRFLRARYVWRNAHSPSSEITATPVDVIDMKLWPAIARLSTGWGEMQLTVVSLQLFVKEEVRRQRSKEGVHETVWQLGLTLPLYCRERRSAGWPIFWSTTRSKPICCHRQGERCWEKGIFALSCMARWRSWICRSLKRAIATKGIRPILRHCC